jgi:hypothetical protein
VKRSRQIRRPTLALLAAIAIAALSACSAPATEGSPGKFAVPEKNIEAWVLPLDQFQETTIASKQGVYAESLLVQPCMEKAGFSWNVPWSDPAADAGPSWNPVGRRLFTAALAKQWGYRLAPGTNSNSAAQNQLSSQEQSAFDGCLAKARKELPLLMSSDPFAGVAYMQAAKDAAVRAAATRWKACMLPLGISDLPNSPKDFPSPSLSTEFGTGGMDQPDPISPPTARELEVATTDFNCQVSSRYRQASYDAEWSHQLVFLHDNADQLSRVASDISKYEKSVLKIIASHAPKG